jgi:hypothetical protein
MSRNIDSPPYSQDDPSPGGGERHRKRRVIIFVIVLIFSGALLVAGRDLQTVLITVLSIGLAGATIARWVTGDGPLPTISALLAQGRDR